MKDPRPGSNLQPDPSDELALIERLVARDQAALGALYDRYASVVYALAFKITGNSGEAEDVVVDSFWQVWQQAGRYDRTRGPVGAWVFTIARSRALDRLRALRRSPLVEPDEQAEAEAARRVAESDSPEQNAWLVEQSSLVRGALAELTPVQREAIELAFYHGLSHAEIAERLNQPLGTIKTRIRLGLMRMRERLKGQLTRPKRGRPDAPSVE